MYQERQICGAYKSAANNSRAVFPTELWNKHIQHDGLAFKPLTYIEDSVGLEIN